MKKIISLVLCLAMCLSVLCVAAVPAAAADEGTGDAKKFFTVTQAAAGDDQLTFTVKINKDIKNFCGTNINIKFDPAVLKVNEKATVVKTANFAGEFINGVSYDDKGTYVIAYINSSNVSVTTAKEFATVTFDIISDERPATSVDFYCVEFMTDDSVANDIGPEDEAQLFKTFAKISTLGTPALEGAVMADGGITVMWKATAGADSYTVLRKLASGEDTWARVGTASADAEEFTDTTVESGVKYTYSVYASNSSGDGIYDSKGVSALYIAKPDYTVENTADGILVKWNEVDGAQSYKVTRKTASDEEWVLIAKPAAGVTEYTDKTVKSGESYEYDVNAVNGSFSTFAADEGKSSYFVSVPEITSVINETAGIALAWKEIEGAESYAVYKKNADSESWKQVGTVDAASECTYLDTKAVTGDEYNYAVKAVSSEGESAMGVYAKDFMRVPTTDVIKAQLKQDGIYIEWQGLASAEKYTVYRRNVTGAVWKKVADVSYEDNSCLDTSAAGGAEYVYAVTVTIGTSESARGGESGAVYYLAAPVLTAENKDNGITVSWAACEGSTEYIVYRQPAGGELEKVSTVRTNTYTDTKTVFGQEYSYMVIASDGEHQSLASDQTAPILRMAAPKGVTASNGLTGVEVEWTAMASAESYNVYRKAGSGAFEYIGSSEGTSFTDESAVSGTKYSYAVEACVGSSTSIRSAASSALLYVAVPEITSIAGSSSGVTVKWNAVSGASKYRVSRKTASGAWTKLADTASASYTDKSAAAGNVYYYRVDALASDGKTVLNATDKNGVEFTFCETPAVSSVSNVIDGITVKWGAVAGAEKYRLYRKTGSGSWTKVGDTTGTSYTDKSAENGKTYYYTVRCMNSDGNYSSAYDTTGKKIVCVATPKVSSAAAAATGVTVKWNKIEGADKYRLYRKTGNGSWATVVDTTAVSYTDTTAKSGTEYTYTVKAFKGSTPSAYDKTGKSVKYLAQPKLSSAKNAVNGVTVKWGAVSGAESYRLYRKTADGSWTKVVDTTATSYTDTKPTSGTTYYYTVKVINSDVTSTYDKTGLSVKYVAAPKVSKISAAASSINVTWASVKGASSYYVYRKAGSATSWTKVATVTSASYTDKNVKSGTKYIYTLKAVMSDGTVSAYQTAGWSLIFLTAPKLSSATSATAGITVKWGAVTGAGGYYVYRKTGSDGWKKIATVNSGSTVSYVDKTAEKGVTYTYTVKAFNGSSVGSYNTSGISCTDKY